MNLFLEIIVISMLIGGMCYLFLDIDIIKIIGIAMFPIMLIALGFVMGIGIHLTNVVFGW